MLRLSKLQQAFSVINPLLPLVNLLLLHPLLLHPLLLHSNLIGYYNTKSATVPVVSELLTARHILRNPELYHQIRHQVVQYMSDNRNNSYLRICEGINLKFLYRSGLQPSTHHSYDDYLAKMSSPYTCMGQPEITAVSALYGKEIHVHFNDTTLPPPHFATTGDSHLRYTQMSRHYDTFQLIVPTPFLQPNPHLQVVAYLLRRHDTSSSGPRDCQRVVQLLVCVPYLFF